MVQKGCHGGLGPMSLTFVTFWQIFRLAPLALGSFWLSWPLGALKAASWKRIIVLGAFYLFLVWGGDAPNPFRDIPFYSMSLHSAGLRPGKTKP